jgi:hypothetical protein
MPKPIEKGEAFEQEIDFAVPIYRGRKDLEKRGPILGKVKFVPPISR